MIESQIKTRGDVERIIEYKNGDKEIKWFKNTVLTTGREALAKSLANDIGDSFSNYVTYMIFGNQGTTGSGGGTPKYVPAHRTALFSTPLVSKSVFSTVDGTQVIFTSVLSFAEFGVTHSEVIDEMALVLANNDLYSMVTFPRLTKTQEMQITWNWRLNFV